MKERVQELFKIIKDANKELEEIRSTCKHETSHEVNYSHYGDMRNIQVGEMCDICHKFLRETKPFKYEEFYKKNKNAKKD